MRSRPIGQGGPRPPQANRDESWGGDASTEHGSGGGPRANSPQIRANTLLYYYVQTQVPWRLICLLSVALSFRGSRARLWGRGTSWRGKGVRGRPNHSCLGRPFPANATLIFVLFCLERGRRTHSALRQVRRVGEIGGGRVPQCCYCLAAHYVWAGTVSLRMLLSHRG